MTEWLKRFYRGKQGRYQTDAIALIDASTVYGAGRWIFSEHEKANWGYAHKFKAEEDRILFMEFLHDIVLYDYILMDNTSVVELHDELVRIFAELDAASGEEIVRTDFICPDGSLSGVMRAVCKLVAEASRDRESADTLLGIDVPWYYGTLLHYDRHRFGLYAKEWDLSEAFMPITIFIFRGLCYAGYANSLTKTANKPVAYLAAPGRLQALKPIISKEALNSLEYPRHSYADLVGLLGLPSKGYDFSSLGIQPALLSDISFLADGDPLHALKSACEIRKSKEAQAVRKEWSERLWRNSPSCAVGVSRSNVLSGNNVWGNVSQVIYAAAVN